MRSGARFTAVVVATALGLAAITPAAVADRHKPVPSQAKVDAARDTADQKAADVAAIQAQLAVANAHLADAAHRAELAAEAYNGAMWRLQQAKEATAQAKAEAAEAAAGLEEQRGSIAALVTQTSIDGSSLNGVRALFTEGGPQSVMESWGAAQSAGDSMQAQYDQYTAMAALAEVATKKAQAAERAQEKLAEQAARLRDDAAAAANDAQSDAATIAGQRRVLITELAAAQDVSLRLATERQHGLEKIAEEKAAAAKAKEAADKAKDAADQTNHELENLPEEGGWDDPGLPVPAGTTAGAAKAIRFARAQLGEPYLWAAAGPDSWDCSGLTMMAWRQGGVALPHYSAAQYQRTKHLDVAHLRPGDLVFWGTSPNTIHHVALYIGSGQIIHAPRTGDVVRVAGMYDWEPPNFFGRP